MSRAPPPSWYWVAAAVLSVWNLMGLAAFVYDGMITAETLATLPPEEAAMYAARPGWVVVAFGAAVFAGTGGCAALLYRRAMAKALFGVSLAAVLVQDSYLFMSDTLGVLGVGAVIMPVLVIASLVFALWLTVQGDREGWWIG
jgi:hypothetical protein